MGKLTTLVNINSRDRNRGEIGDFVYRLEESMGNVESIELVGIQLKASSYTINGTNNKLYIKLSNTNEIVITLTKGNYDSDTLMVLIKTSLISAEVVGDNFEVVFDDINYKYTISSDNSFEILFSNTLNSVAELLGFRNIDYIGTNTYTSDNQLKLNQDNFSISLDCIESNVLTNKGKQSIIYTLPNESGVNSMLLFRPKYKLLFKSNKTSLDNITIMVLLDNLRTAELNSNYSLQLLITHYN